MPKALTEQFLFTRRIANAQELVEALQLTARVAGCGLDQLQFNGVIRLQGGEGDVPHILTIIKRNTI